MKKGKKNNIDLEPSYAASPPGRPTAVAEGATSIIPQYEKFRTGVSGGVRQVREFHARARPFANVQ